MVICNVDSSFRICFLSILKTILNSEGFKEDDIDMFLFSFGSFLLHKYLFVNRHVGTVLHGSCAPLRDVSAEFCRYLRAESDDSEVIATSLFQPTGGEMAGRPNGGQGDEEGRMGVTL